jgi:DNA (cytosine-5)-methyltransferase 1
VESLRVLELFCGIGGVAAALGEAADGGAGRVAAAVDVDRRALDVYAANHPGRTVARTLDPVAAADLVAFAADLWTMSPPCQPYTRRGRGGDVDDPRARGFLAVVAAFAEARPPYLFLENVPGFAGSRAHRLLAEELDAAGYRRQERLLCPSELGWPNRRHRFYLVAAGPGAPLAEPAIPPEPPPRRPLAGFLDADPDPELTVPADLVRRYRHALDVVDAADPAALTACFTSAYGRSPVRSGSYLRLPDGSLRRFSPAEILRLLGFPAAFRLPPDLPRAAAWHLAGNSLSLPAVRAMLAAVPGLTACGAPLPEAGPARRAPRSRRSPTGS